MAESFLEFVDGEYSGIGIFGIVSVDLDFVFMKEALLPTVDQLVVDFPLLPDDGEVDGFREANAMVLHDEVLEFGFFIVLVVCALRFDIEQL